MMPEPATPTAVLDRHRQKMQDNALRVESMLHTITTCLDAPQYRGLCDTLLHHARLVAKDLNNGLDSTRFQFDIATGIGGEA